MKSINNFINKNRTTILRIIAVLILAIILLFVVKFISMATKPKKNPTVNTAFFIKNQDERYALFNESGKKLTDFIFTSVENIYNGVAKVTDQEGKTGIINEKGKYVAKPGKYNSIIQNGGLFKVEEKENVYSLLSSSGKKIIKSKKFDLKTNSYIYAATIVLIKDKYVVYTYNGKKVYSFKVNKDKEEQIAPTTSNYLDYVSVYYDGLTIIFNARTGKIISKIKDNEQYCVSSATEKGNIITLNSCVAWYESSENSKFKVIIDGKVKDKNEECDSLYLIDDELICAKNEVSHLLDKKLNILDADLAKMTYKNTKNYAITVGNDVQILKNNKVVLKIENAILADKGHSDEGIYLVYKDSEYTFYNESGKELFGKKYKSALAFDSNGLACVSEDGEKFYFINTKGKKLSDYVDISYQMNDYYIVEKDGKMGVMDKKGKILVDTIYEDIDIKINNEKYYACTRNEEEYKVISIDSKKEVLKFDEMPSFYEHYITIEKDDKTTYYTYSGKKLYEE